MVAAASRRGGVTREGRGNAVTIVLLVILAVAVAAAASVGLYFALRKKPAVVATVASAAAGQAAAAETATTTAPSKGGKKDKKNKTKPKKDDSGSGAVMITDESLWTPDGYGGVVMTFYTFQDNTPNNSLESASGRELKPYQSVAVPFRHLKKFGGKLEFGQNMKIKFLEGKKMRNGAIHSGWVTLDDFCGDNHKDSYCYQSCSKGKCANIDLFIGDFTASMSCKDGGPAGSGTEETTVTLGVAPPGALDIDYGVPASNGNRKCDYNAAKRDQDCFGMANNC